MPWHDSSSDEPTDPRLVQVRALLAQAEAQARAGLPTGAAPAPPTTGGRERDRRIDEKGRPHDGERGRPRDPAVPDVPGPARRGSRGSGSSGAAGESQQPVANEPSDASGRRGARRRRGSDASPPDEVAALDVEPDPIDVARQIVLRQLAMGPRSRRQLFDKLVDKGCEPEVAEATLDRMSEVGLVDDEAYAQSFVRSRQESKGLARRALAQELARKGVDREVADEALAEVGPEDEAERARELVEKRLPRLHGLDRTVQTRRLAGMLARKGYPPGLTYRIVNEALDDAPEHRRD